MNQFKQIDQESEDLELLALKERVEKALMKALPFESDFYEYITTSVDYSGILIRLKTVESDYLEAKIVFSNQRSVASTDISYLRSAVRGRGSLLVRVINQVACKEAGCTISCAVNVVFDSIGFWKKMGYQQDADVFTKWTKPLYETAD